MPPPPSRRRRRDDFPDDLLDGAPLDGPVRDAEGRRRPTLPERPRCPVSNQRPGRITQLLASTEIVDDPDLWLELDNAWSRRRRNRQPNAQERPVRRYTDHANPRLINPRGRQILALHARSLCTYCDAPLPKRWAADHVQPYSKAGGTELENMVASCIACYSTINDEWPGDVLAKRAVCRRIRGLPPDTPEALARLAPRVRHLHYWLRWPLEPKKSSELRSSAQSAPKPP